MMDGDDTRVQGDHWTKTADAGCWTSVRGGVVRFIHSKDGFWRISRTDSWRIPSAIPAMSELVDPPTLEFECTSLADCSAYADFLFEHDASISAWRSADISVESPHPSDPTLLLTMRKPVGEDTAWTSIVDLERNRQNAGSMRIGHSGPETCWIAGEMTISGHSSLPPARIGIGLGRIMYDFAEQVLGKTLVPSGRDFAPGMLSEHSTVFWAKRLRHRSIPTLGPKADARRAIVTDGVRLPRIMERCHDELGVFVALVDAVDGQFVGAILDLGDGRQQVFPLWIVAPDGRWITENGAISPREAQAIVDRCTDGKAVLQRGPLTIDEIIDVDRIHGRGETLFPKDLPREVVEGYADAVAIADRHSLGTNRTTPSPKLLAALSAWRSEDDDVPALQ